MNISLSFVSKLIARINNEWEGNRDRYTLKIFYAYIFLNEGWLIDYQIPTSY